MPPLMPSAISRELSDIRAFAASRFRILRHGLRNIGLARRDQALAHLLLGDGGRLAGLAVHARAGASLQLLAARGRDADEFELVFHGLNLHPFVSSSRGKITWNRNS